MQRDPAELHRIFYTTRFGRKLDQLGFVRFRHWRIYGDHGLAGRKATLWLYGETLVLEFSNESLAQYSVTYAPDRRHFQEVAPRQLFDTQYQSSQLPLRELRDGEWLKVVRLPSWHRRSRAPQQVRQLSLVGESSTR